MKAIKTRYNGAEFRSRLEARWAAFFDLCGWRWTFEPFDLDGWIPDFALHTDKDDIACLVEVKPLTPSDLKSDSLCSNPELEKAFRHSLAASDSPEFDHDEWKRVVSDASKDEFWRFHEEHEARVAEWARDKYEVLICGLMPFRGPDYGGWSIGTLLTIGGPDVTAISRTWLWPDDRIDFSVEIGSYHGRITGDYDGNPHCKEGFDADRLWREAGNRVRWEPAR